MSLRLIEDVAALLASCQGGWSSVGAAATMVSQHQRTVYQTYLCLFLQIEGVDLLQFAFLRVLSKFEPGHCNLCYPPL